MNPFAERKFGRIEISREAAISMSKEQMTLFGSNFFVFKSEHDFSTDTMHLTCACELFDVVPEGSAIPFYDVIFKAEDFPKERNYRIVVS